MGLCSTVVIVLSVSVYERGEYESREPFLYKILCLFMDS